MKIFVLLSLIGIAVSYKKILFKPVELIQDEGWQIWKSGYDRKFSDFGEEQVRFAIWKDNFNRILQFNKKTSNVVLAMNQFGDMTNTEFREIMNGYFPRKTNRTGSTFLSPSNWVAPDEVDWRAHGYVTPVKNQGSCGSCWSFSTTGALEGQHFKKTNKLVSLSEQNLVDCSTEYGNHGCHGGMMDFAFKYIKENGGVDTEESYPYQAEDLQCRFKVADVGADDTGYVDVVPQGSEDALKTAVGANGPVSVAIDASHFSFQFYKSGVYNEAQCDAEKLDHGVLVVGYGRHPDDGDYWIVKNSWGPTWGDGGYILMSRNKNNQCGIASCASYPLV